jgi:MSHA biogenesis protein MshL
VRQALSTIVGNSEGRSMVLNPESGVIVVRAMPAEIRNVESYLRATQLVIERQVMLEAKIIEVNLSDSYQAGVNWAAFSQSANSRGAFGMVDGNSTLRGLDNATAGLAGSSVSALPGAAGSLAGAGEGFFGLALQTSNFAALLNFLETQGTVNVLSSPRIATLNNQKAVLKVGSDDYYVTSVTAGSTVVGTTGTTTNTPSYSTQVFFSGIALDVTPQIDENDNIVLHVHPAISSVSSGKTAIPTGDANIKQIFLPTNEIRESDSIVRVQDGRIVAIGGLMKQASNNMRNQIPGLGDAPVVGAAFGNRNKQSQKQELVILIKPTIIRGDSSWQQDLLDVQGRIGEPALPPTSGR